MDKADKSETALAQAKAGGTGSWLSLISLISLEKWGAWPFALISSLHGGKFVNH